MMLQDPPQETVTFDRKEFLDFLDWAGLKGAFEISDSGEKSYSLEGNLGNTFNLDVIRIRPQIMRIAREMEAGFAKHDAARGDPFQKYSFEFLHTRFCEEWETFMGLLGMDFTLCENPGSKKPDRIWHQAANCSNFILMIAEKYERDFNGAEK